MMGRRRVDGHRARRGEDRDACTPGSNRAASLLVVFLSLAGGRMNESSSAARSRSRCRDSGVRDASGFADMEILAKAAVRRARCGLKMSDIDGIATANLSAASGLERRRVFNVRPSWASMEPTWEDIVHRSYAASQLRALMSEQCNAVPCVTEALSDQQGFPGASGCKGASTRCHMKHLMSRSTRPSSPRSFCRAAHARVWNDPASTPPRLGGCPTLAQQSGSVRAGPAEPAGRSLRPDGQRPILRFMTAALSPTAREFS